MSKAVVLLSGGLDSVTAMYVARQHYDVVLPLFFRYGQTNYERELEACLEVSNIPRTMPLMLYGVPNLGRKSQITGDKPQTLLGMNKDEVLKANFVPNRNAVFLSLAFAYAYEEEAECVVTGFHHGLEGGYFPDTNPSFLAFFQAMEDVALRDASPRIFCWSPFLNEGREYVVRRARELGVPIEKTWSCYTNGPELCGKCGACIDRQAGLALHSPTAGSE